MATVRDLKRNLQSVNVLYEAITAAKKNAREMVMLNLGQLFIGENNAGESFKKYKWKEYADYKESLNSRPGLGYPDLKLTGAFYKGFYARFSSSGILMGSTDEKEAWLQKHYSKGGKQTIFGLTDENMKTWNEVAFFNDFAKAITATTGLRFTSS